MTLYHGSNVTVQVPKLIVPFRALDFGVGFYTTTNRDQASDFAKKVVERTAKALQFIRFIRAEDVP